MTKIFRTYRFEAAHHLPKVPASHKCHRVHGHNYRVDVSVAGSLDERGFVLDFFELDAIVAPLVAALDHRLINDVEGLENPTAEIIAKWFWDHVCGGLNGLRRRLDVAVRVYETEDCSAEFTA